MPFISKLYDNRIVRAAIIIVLAMLATLSLYQGVRNATLYSQDFQWDAAKALCMRLDPYELSENPGSAAAYPELEGFYRMFTDKGLTQKMEANQFPSLLMLLAPMTVFSPYTAKIVWLVLNLLFTAGIIWLLRKTVFEDLPAFDCAALCLLMIAGTPYRNQLGVGQHTLFAFFFFMLAVYRDKRDVQKERKGIDIPMAACLFVSYFKYTLTAPLVLYFVYRRRLKELIVSVAGHVVLTAVSAAWLGKSFLYMIIAPLKVASVLTAEGGIDLGVLLKSPGAYAAAVLIMAALAVMAFRMPKGCGNLYFAILILWSLILTYHRTYDFLVLTAVAGMFCEEPERREGTVLKAYYMILLFAVFFVLRVFGESTASLTAAGIMYYLFTAAVTWEGIKTIKDKGNE